MFNKFVTFSQPFVVPLRILMLFGGGLIAVLGSESIGYGGAGPLGCITAAFVSCYFWSKQGWEVEDVSDHLPQHVTQNILLEECCL
jgi:hypothetical protein